MGNRNRDIIAQWFSHGVEITRKVGETAYGDEPLEYGAIIDDNGDETSQAPVDLVPCRIVEKLETVTGASGQEIISTVRLHTFVDTPDVPIGSKAVLPSEYGGRVVRIVATSRAHGGGMPTPDHYTMWGK